MGERFRTARFYLIAIFTATLNMRVGVNMLMSGVDPVDQDVVQRFLFTEGAENPYADCACGITLENGGRCTV